MIWGRRVSASVKLGISLLLFGCATPPPDNQDNICDIFRQYPSWYEDALEMNDEYVVPIQISMAFMKQESSFVGDAKPPRYYFLGFIPWGRMSSAYGYAQAQDPVWSEYQDEVNSWSSRDDFGDAIMFIGWYMDGSQKRLGISKWDAYNQYLAYHDGRGGFKRKTYQNKPSLMKVARRVEQTAKNYGWQLKKCQAELEDNRSWFF
ncbi:transglycosylase SLT domain-containing protein [Vibrio sp. E150_018]